MAQMNNSNKARVIAYYLPQFHPIPENDQWWGKGFTEWTNVGKAKPLFRGHYQPRVPADLGYYDLRMPEIKEAQAEMAREAGVEGFCYWHYWFGEGKRILDGPLTDVLETGKPDFPFCLGWANHSWSTRTWNNVVRRSSSTMLLEQKYLGEKDYTDFFYDSLRFFKDKRYITVDGKPLFAIYRPLDFPDVKTFIRLWKHLAIENGLPGIHFVGITETAANFHIDEHFKKTYKIARLDEGDWCCQRILDLGFDAVNSRGTSRAELIVKGKFIRLFQMALRRFLHIDTIDKYSYKKIVKHLYTLTDARPQVYPTLLPQYDRSPRGGKSAVIYHGSTPELFRKSIESLLPYLKEKDREHNIVFLQSWNEWGEGNYVEPDIVYGKGYLEALRDYFL